MPCALGAASLRHKCYLLLTLLLLFFTSLLAQIPNVAVLVVGQKRALCSPLFYNNLHDFLIRPLNLGGFSVNTFIYTTVHDEHFSPELVNVSNCTEALRVLRPKSIHFRTEVDELAPNDKCPYNSSMVMKVYQQFYAVHQAFKQQRSFQGFAGSQSSWLFKVRTDNFFLSPFPVQVLQLRTFAFVPFGGMTYDRSCELLNDHMFICPTELCTPYFDSVLHYVKCELPNRDIPGSHDPRFNDIPQIAIFHDYTSSNLTSLHDIAYTLIRSCSCGLWLECDRLLVYAPSYASSFYDKCVELQKTLAAQQSCSCN
jgi:hypothetical protein